VQTLEEMMDDKFMSDVSEEEEDDGGGGGGGGGGDGRGGGGCGHGGKNVCPATFQDWRTSTLHRNTSVDLMSTVT
jgi:hypothetical protein